MGRREKTSEMRSTSKAMHEANLLKTIDKAHAKIILLRNCLGEDGVEITITERVKSGLTYILTEIADDIRRVEDELRVRELRG